MTAQAPVLDASAETSPNLTPSSGGWGARVKKSQADRMVECALDQDTRLFHDQRGDAYIRIWNDDVYQTIRLRTRAGRAWLAGLLWKKENKAPGSESLQSALNVLESMANEAPEIPLYNRVAPDGSGGIYIDMADDEWRAIHVTREGWTIEHNPPILFRRYNHQKPLPEPVPGGSVVGLLDLANIKNLGDRLLYVVSTISYLVPGIPHVIVIFYGPQGSGKSWALIIIRAVIDPSTLSLLTIPRRERELVQNLDHHYCAFYDNTGKIPPWISNVLCRAATGTGVSKRALYTDDDDVIYEYHRCCGLTDINVAAERGDLFDRAILFGLERIDSDKLKTEREIKTLLNEGAGEILGGILDTLVKALNNYSEVKTDSLFRMADFTKWGCAITQALDIDPETFIAVYHKNIESQNLEVIKASPVADVLIKFMETWSDETWEGTASELWSNLQTMAEALKISTRQKAWPKKPHALIRRLNELAPSFPAAGYEITKGHSGKSKTIIITSVAISAINGINESYSKALRALQNSILKDNTTKTEDIDRITPTDSENSDNSDGKTCIYCGIPLNTDTGHFVDPWTGKRYCRQHWLAEKRIEEAHIEK